MIREIFGISSNVTFYENPFLGTRFVFSETIMEGQIDRHKFSNI